MQFYYTQKRESHSYAQRSVTMGSRGMVASSQQLATLSGYKVLNKGGNAIDAAVAMVSTLSVVEPHSVGIGGDAFALIYLAEDDKLLGMNGSGRAPYRASLDWFRDRQIEVMPERGMLSVTVPGALQGWAQAVERYGNLTLSELLEDAIDYAENGFPITEVIAGEWKNAEDTLLSHENSSKTYLINGKAPHPGHIFRNKDLAHTYRKITATGISSFYEGDVCGAILEFTRRNGGLLSRKDFHDHQTTWVEPLSTDYRGYTVYELPPNGQGITALEMLNVLEGYDIGSLGHNDPEYLHLLIEAKKVAFNDRDCWVTDPEFEDVPVSRLISKDYAAQWRPEINPAKAMVPPLPSVSSKGSDTVYVTAVDQSGNAASFISSIYMAFGSGMVVDGTGVVLQNRGHSFSLDPAHPNRLEPHKRPRHTIIPGMVFKQGRFVMSFGVMGGDMQPQGHVQFLINLIDFKMNLQEAVDVPRIRHTQGLDVYLEDGIPDETALDLQKRGHRIIQAPEPVNQVGGGQAIYFDARRRLLLGASDRRKDGCAIGY
ncbi:MAG: gamma-glutamyltransferase [Deltaproteobacteria bacterium]|nr:MAG: gamma-glutamyltransferase [Deltaproteobacteria bacterium]